MKLNEWNVVIKPDQEAIFDLGNGAFIRARIQDGQLYVNSFPGVLSVIPDSGNAVYMSVVPISKAERIQMGVDK